MAMSNGTILSIRDNNNDNDGKKKQSFEKKIHNIGKGAR
jgi:hypothetical protein